MTLGSLFDGAGTFPFAGILSGIQPLWASEIEPFPITVTKARLPKMKHLGDVTKIDGSKIPPVDVLTFGSPCQDLSVAGRRAGLDGERSGLFLEAIRIIKEMRSATNGKYPSIAIWENVPGAFSSNNGEDFRIVLEEFCKIKNPETVIPRPTTRGGSDGKWLTAGSIVADGFSLAWRVLDAQYWGVPQRRRRIFLVADFRDECAAEILFEREGLQRRFAESRKTWHGITPDTTYGSYEAGKCFDARGKGNGNIAPTITGDHNDRVTDYSALVVVKNLLLNDQGGSSIKVEAGKVSPTLRAQTHDHLPCVVIGFDPYNETLTGDKAATLGVNCEKPTGRNGVIIATNILQDPISSENVTPCLSAGNSKTGQAGLGVVYAIDRAAFNQGENAQYKIGIDESGTAHTLVARGPGAVCVPILSENVVWIVRRLMPIECARLQGMPDWWCKDIPHADAPEYKMWGNGMALPCVMYVMQGISAWWRKRLLEVCA